MLTVCYGYLLEHLCHANRSHVVLWSGDGRLVAYQGQQAGRQVEFGSLTGHWQEIRGFITSLQPFWTVWFPSKRATMRAENANAF